MTNTLRHARTLTLTHDEIPRTCFLVATHLLIFPSRAILSRCDLAFYLFFRFSVAGSPLARVMASYIPRSQQPCFFFFPHSRSNNQRLAAPSDCFVFRPSTYPSLPPSLEHGLSFYSSCSDFFFLRYGLYPSWCCWPLIGTETRTFLP